MNKLSLLFLVLLLSSCSQQRLYSLIAKTPKLDYEKPTDYRTFNDYQKDAIYLKELILRSYPRLETKISKPDFLKASDELVKKLGSVSSDLEFEAYLKKYIALLKDGHSYVQSFGLSIREETKYFCWSIYKEKEDWVITSIDSSMDTSIIASRLVSVNDIPIKEIEDRARNFENGENYYSTNRLFTRTVRYPKYWKALGIIEDENRISFSVIKNDTVEKFHLEAKAEFSVSRKKRKDRQYPFMAKQNNGYSYEINASEDFSYLQMNTSLDYVSFKDGISNYTSFWIRPFAKAYGKKMTEDAENFGQVLQKMFAEMNEKGINNLIIDLRYNSGGDERTGKQLIWYLTERTDIKGFTDMLHVSEYFKKTAKKDYKKYDALHKKKYNQSLPFGEINLTKEFYDQPYFYNITQEDSPYLLDASIPKFKGNVYVIVNSGTFSAAQCLATTISDNDLGTIVGTPTGNMPTCQTGASVLKLPNTKTILQLSYTYMERPDTSKNYELALFPDIEVYLSFEDFNNGKDPRFETILDMIKKD